MVFSSVTFLVYFLPFFLLLYTLTPKAYRNGLLLCGSILFYSWGAPRFIFVILLTTFLDFFLVRFMDRTEGAVKRKTILVFSVCMNLGLLFYFKYCNFFIENVNAITGSLGAGTINMLAVVLPIGISFYTFESLTYVIDVYRRVHKPLDNFWNYQLYILMFPKLIAGPIIRYHEIADQITDRSLTDNFDNKLSGFLRFCIGLAKKVFIANTMAEFADDIFDGQINDLTTTAAWLGMLSYSFQIYFDFSGYSDMAIGLGQMFGFKFPENFMNPYTSQSITEFWRRWHITLGNWMKNYLYIPLGGNKTHSRSRLFFNLWLVFLVSGLWHGASWSFVVWGAYHGSFLVLERVFLLRLYKSAGKSISILITFLLVAIGWVIFRADNLQEAIQIIQKLFTFETEGFQPILNQRFLFYFLLALLFSFFTVVKKGQEIQNDIYEGHINIRSGLKYAILSCILFSLALANLASSEFNPFIYFRF